MTVENISISVRTNADKAASKLSSLVSAMENVKKAADNMVEGTGDISVSISRAAKKAEKEFEPLSSEMQKTIKGANKYQVLVHKAADASVKMEKAFEKGNEAAAWREREKEINATTQAQKEFLKNQPKVAPKPVSSEIQEFLTNANAIDLLKFRIESLNAEMQKAFQSGDANKAANYRQQIINATAALQKQEEALKGVEEQSKKTEKHHSKFLASIKRIAMYRMLRTALKEITQGFNEGLKNAYNFSKGINGSLAAALDNLATKSLTMKNQMGSAFGALLQAIAPIVLQIISLVTRLMQALSALFAAIGGGQYLIAKDTATAWDKATGAAQKYKNTILGFDEINRLDDPNSGGGGATTNYADMFTEGQLPKWAQFIKDNFTEIKGAAVAIGIAIAGWKITEAIAGISGLSLSSSKLVGIALSISGAFLLVKGAIDAIAKGASWQNVNKMIFGTTMLAGGLYLAFGKVGGAMGLLVGGLTLLAVGFKGWIDDGELSKAELYAIEGGLLAVGAAVSLLTGTWFPLLVAELAGLVLAVGTHTSEINQAVDTFFNNVILKIDGFLKDIEEQTGIDLTSLRRTVIFTLNYIRFDIEATVTKIGWIVQDLGKLVKAVKEGDWDSAWTAMDMLTHDVSLNVAKDVKGMAEAVTEHMMNGEESAQSLSEAFHDLLIDVRNEAPLAESGIKKFTETVSKSMDNAGTPLQNFWNKLTGILSTLQQISGISTTGGGLIGLLSGNGWNFDIKDIFGFANGGMPETGSLFVAGEAGAEIVTNMGNGKTGVTNVEQMEAAVANGNINVVNAVYAMANAVVKAVNDKDTDIILDGQSLADKMYHYNHQAANRHGVAMVSMA